MRKALLMLGVLAALVVGTLTFAASIGNLGRSLFTTAGDTVASNQQHTSRTPIATTKPTLSEKQGNPLFSGVQAEESNPRKASGIWRAAGNKYTGDLWNNAPVIYSMNPDGMYNADTNTLTFPNNGDYFIFAGVDEDITYYIWDSMPNVDYVFEGTLKADVSNMDSTDGLYSKVKVCIAYLEASENMIYMAHYQDIELNNENQFTSDFEVKVHCAVAGYPLMVAFWPMDLNFTTDISSTNNQFYYISDANISDKWTSDNDMTGLGLEGLNSDAAYTVMCDDGITTLGLYYDNGVYVTGINTTASEVTFPNNVVINGNILPIKALGLPESMKPSVSTYSETTDGDGSESNPYNIGQIIDSTADATGVWVEGYVVGFINGTSYPSGAVFSNDTENASYTNTNCLLAAGPDIDDASLAIPAGIKAGDTRDMLGLGNNPAIYKKKVRVKGDVAKYFGTRGLKNISECVIIEDSSEPGTDINYVFDWSAAPNLTSLNIAQANKIYVDFANSSLTDLYVGTSSSFYGGTSRFADMYLHIPYGDRRDDYSYYGFKRVLVGDELPDYPEPEFADWVIPGENEGEYFGISQMSNGNYCVKEIFTDNDFVTLPFATPATGGRYYIRYFGYDGVIRLHAPNLKSVRIPATYFGMSIDWENNRSITDLYMDGDVINTDWMLTADMSVHVTNRSSYNGYINDSRYNLATIVPDGWSLDWITVNVANPGEFEQTYLEMTDYNWSYSTCVKVAGTLNENDLMQIRNLEETWKLDLSEAQFEELPAHFMQYKTSLLEVKLPENITTIPGYAFDCCDHMTTLVAPGVNTVNEFAFRGCIDLKDFDISNVKIIEQNAFDSCEHFNPTSFSASLEKLGARAFARSGITDVVIPEGISIIDLETFESCSNLQHVTLPSSLTTIMFGAFTSCYILREIEIPEGVTAIDEFSFNCSGLTDVTLPSTLTWMGQGAFENCDITRLTCKAITPPSVENGFFNFDTYNCQLFVPSAAIDTYRYDSSWSQFYHIGSIENDANTIVFNIDMPTEIPVEEDVNDGKYREFYFISTDNYEGGGQLTVSGSGAMTMNKMVFNHMFRNRDSYGARCSFINLNENVNGETITNNISFEKGYWHFISFPYEVRMEDIYGLNDTDFVIRSYNGSKRAAGAAGSNWENVPADGVLVPGQGYIIQAANNTRNEYGDYNQATVCFPSNSAESIWAMFFTGNIGIPLKEYPSEFAHNSSWNLVGNPYPCYYNMHSLEEDFTTPIILWRGTSYQAYSPVDDDIILRPYEAFFVQRPEDRSDIGFGVEGRMHYIDYVYNNFSTPGIYAPAKVAPTRSVFNFNIEGCDGSDRARIVMNEAASMNYESTCDAPKFFAEASRSIELYVNGDVQYDICERPLDAGSAALGMRVSKAGEYTLSLSGANLEGWTVMLTDTLTGLTVNLSESAYTFDAEKGTDNSRFVLTFAAPKVDNIDELDAEAMDVTIFNTTGVAIFQGKLRDFKASANAGIYVVVANDKAYKIVLK